MPWLSQQYALDSFSRIREQRLQHVRNNQQSLNRRPAVRNEDVADDADGTQQGRHVRIPKSFTSSPKFLSSKVLDALETVRFCGRPLTFLTFTTNPKWQELLEMLPAGCTAYDCPAITNRVFKMKLDAFLTELKCGSLWSMTLVSEDSTNPAGRVWTYSLRRSDMPSTVPGYLVVSVIEFQKRGLPHAHIVFRLAVMPVGADHTAAPEGSLQPWADNFTCAQKLTPDVLAEHGMLERLPSSGYAISKHMRAINYRDKQRMCPKAKFYINIGAHRPHARCAWR
eukprot:gene13824-16336_t